MLFSGCFWSHLNFSDVGYEEKRLSLIRRIDFAWAVEKDEEKKKQKKSAKESSTPWQWQGMVENLQLAHQELSVIIDLINTVSCLSSTILSCLSHYVVRLLLINPKCLTV